MDYLYRRLRRTDAALLKRLLKVFGEAFDDIPAYQGNLPGDAYLKSLLGKSNFIALVALNEDEVLGGLVAYELDKCEQERREIYIYDMAVSKQCRRQGIATNLIGELKKIARKNSAYVIFVQADRGDTAAIRLYESLGKRESVYQFDIPVD